MIILGVICLLLYALGGALAWALTGMHIETEAGRHSSYRDPFVRLAAVVLWPSLAFYMAFARDDDEDESTAV